MPVRGPRGVVVEVHLMGAEHRPREIAPIRRHLILTARAGDLRRQIGVEVGGRQRIAGVVGVHPVLETRELFAELGREVE